MLEPMPPLRVVFGKRVRERRLELGLTQEKLAELAKRHWTYIGAIERGERNVTLAVVEAIAKALQVDVTTLFHSERDET